MSGIAPDPSPGITQWSRIPFQLPDGDPDEAGGPRKVEPHNRVSCLKASASDGPVVTRDDPSVATDEFRVPGDPLLVRGQRRLPPVVVIELDDGQARLSPRRAATVVLPEATGPMTAIRFTDRACPNGVPSTRRNGSVNRRVRNESGGNSPLSAQASPNRFLGPQTGSDPNSYEIAPHCSSQFRYQSGIPRWRLSTRDR